ncbi:phage tail protein [Streptomyces sp. NPDC055709]
MTVQPISSGSFSLTFPNADDEDRLGVFTGLSGLSLWMEGDELYEGGVNESPHYLTTHIRYKPLVLSRPVSQFTPKTCAWVLDNMRTPKPRTGEITFRDSGDSPIATIEFLSLLPVAWRGPTLDTMNPQVAVEEIEFVHGGFTFKPSTPAGS